MENNENFVTEQVAENVEQTTEETPKMYTEAEFNSKLDEVLGKKIARKEARIRKEYEKKYGDLENVLRVGTGKESVEEMTDTFSKFYESKGIPIPKKPMYSDRDNEILARNEAEEVISMGFDEVVEEVDRLAELGIENMTARDKAYFKVLAEHRQNYERQNELSKIGVTADVYNSKEFQDFAKQFNSTTPIADIYNIYNKTQPKKDIKPMGSMTNKTSEDGTVKDFYTRDEALQFTKADFDKNPALFKAVEESMTKW
jgi:3-methyladenine DNA glycosylase AlkC